jgi:hypothetical protein
VNDCRVTAAATRAWLSRIRVSLSLTRITTNVRAIRPQLTITAPNELRRPVAEELPDTGNAAEGERSAR